MFIFTLREDDDPDDDILTETFIWHSINLQLKMRNRFLVYCRN